jgi:HlyD family secretion protein
MFPAVPRCRRTFGVFSHLLLAGSLITLAGCNFPKAEAESTPQPGRQAASEPATVNVATAQAGDLGQTREYTGTTQPFRLVSLRSQVEGQLLDLAVTVGDPVTQGQILAQVDATVLQANLAEAQAEVAARQAEVAQAQAEVNDVKAQVGSAQVELQQAQSDLKRSQSLFQQGAIPEQQSEEAQEQVRTQQQAVAAVQGRVTAQQAVVAGEQQRQSFSTLTSSINGAVVERLTEPGNLVQPGTEVLRLGDFSQVKVAAQISELELGDLRLGQPVQVRLDAFPKQKIQGTVTRISPAADPVARLVPIEVTIPNPGERLGSGLLARVTLAQSGRSRIVIPETALEVDQDKKSSRQPSNGSPSPERPRSNGTVFVITGAKDQPKVTAREVTLGDRNDGQVEILSGLREGDRYITLSSKALKNGDAVRPSILSDQP